MHTIQKVLVTLLLLIVAPTSVRAPNVPAPVDTSAAVKKDTVRQVPTRPVTPIPAPAAVRTDDDAAFASAAPVVDSAAGEVARDSVSVRGRF